MKKILVIGLADNIGGIETFFHTYYKNMDRKELHFDFATVCNTVAFGDEYKKNGSNIYNLPNFMKHPIKYYRTLRKIMHENKYDIIHINMLSAANILPIKAAKKEKNEKIIVHSHNSDTPSGFLRKVLDKINRRALKDRKLVKLACGQKAGEWLFGKNSNFTIINNAIDIDRFKYNKKNRDEIRNKYGIKDSEVLLGNVGRLCEQKNQTFLIDVLRLLDGKFKLMLIGSGDKKTELKRLIDDYSLEKRVIFVENTAEVEKYYSALDVFVFPSLFEGMPVAPIEAQANGLKCIISKNISKEVNIGNCISLGLSEEKWAHEIRKIKRRLTNPCIANSYKINSQAQNLKAIYGVSDDIKVSIIVPIYNSELYLNECLLSIKNQSYKNIEIIMVDDGSKDGSKKIAKKFLKDKRFKYFYQENSGANIARGNGIKQSTGSYIMFVDSDDWIEDDAVKLIVETFNKTGSDIVHFNNYFEPNRRKNKEYLSKNDKTLLDKKEIAEYLFCTTAFRELAFNCYDASLIKKNFVFGKKISYAEDYLNNLNLFTKARKVSILSKPLYHYRKNNQKSTTKTADFDRVNSRIDDTVVICNAIKNKLNVSSLDKTKKDMVYLNIFEICMWSMYSLASVLDMNKDRFKDISKKILESDFYVELEKEIDEESIIKLARIRKKTYFFFHYKMIKAIIEKDIDKAWNIACKYNSYNKANK